MPACIFCTNPGPVTFTLPKNGNQTGKKPSADGSPSVTTFQFLCQCLGVNFDPIFNQEKEKEPDISLSFCDDCEILFRDVEEVYVQLWKVVGRARKLILGSNNGNNTTFFGGTTSNSDNLRRFRRQICGSQGGGGSNEAKSANSPNDGISRTRNRKRGIVGEDVIDALSAEVTVPEKLQKIEVPEEDGKDLTENKVKPSELAPVPVTSGSDIGEIEVAEEVTVISSNNPSPALPGEEIVLDNGDQDEQCDSIFVGVGDNNNDDKCIESEEGKTNTDPKPHVCPICSRRFRYKKKAYKAHMELHSLGPLLKRYKCRFCINCKINDCLAFSAPTLRLHELEKHADRLTFRCPSEICSEAYGTDYLLKIHIETHRPKGPFSCYICKMDFGKCHRLQDHLIQVHLPKNGVLPRDLATAAAAAAEKAERDAKFSCEVCQRNFFHRAPLRTHRKRRHQLITPLPLQPKSNGQNNECCEFCNRKFSLPVNLSRHLKLVHGSENSGEKPFTCSKCPASFASEVVRHRHEILHCKRDTTFERAKRSADKGQRKKGCPITKKTQFKSFNCVACGKSFQILSYLMKHHRKNHPELLIHGCHLCDKKYSLESLLETHLKTHGTADADGTFTCTVCAKNKARIFKTAEDLTQHLSEVHDGENKFRCLEGTCSRIFPERRLLRAHQMSAHNKQSDFLCESCGKCFLSGFWLREHSKTMHPIEGAEQFPCTQCDKKLFTKNALQKHIYLHHTAKGRSKRERERKQRHLCTYCGEEVIDIKMHIARRHPDKSSIVKKYTCYFCEKLFHSVHELERHMRIHTQEKPRFCHLCPKDFSHLNCLIAHVRRVHGVSLEPSVRGKKSSDQTTSTTPGESSQIQITQEDPKVT